MEDRLGMAALGMEKGPGIVASGWGLSLECSRMGMGPYWKNLQKLQFGIKTIAQGTYIYHRRFEKYTEVNILDREPPGARALVTEVFKNLQKFKFE